MTFEAISLKRSRVPMISDSNWYTWNTVSASCFLVPRTNCSDHDAIFLDETIEPLSVESSFSKRNMLGAKEIFRYRSSVIFAWKTIVMQLCNTNNNPAHGVKIDRILLFHNLALSKLCFTNGKLCGYN